MLSAVVIFLLLYHKSIYSHHIYVYSFIIKLQIFMQIYILVNTIKKVWNLDGDLFCSLDITNRYHIFSICIFLHDTALVAR